MILKNKRDAHHKSVGFTIVELIVVIVIIAILAVITIVAYTSVTKQANESAAKAEARQAADKIVLYHTVNRGKYPADLAAADVSESGKAKFEYSTDATTRSFCLTTTVADMSYFISNSQTAPEAGGCPGHGRDGIASVTNLVADPSFEKAGTNIEVWRNLSTNPNAVPSGAANLYSNSGAIWTVTKESTSTTSNPQGIRTRAKSVLNGAQTNPALMSMYNVDGLQNTGPARTLGAWFYVNASGYEASIGAGSGAQKVPLPAGVWKWITGSAAASVHVGATVSKMAGQGNAEAGHIAYITGVTSLAGDAIPAATIAGDTPSLDPDLTASWTGTANASQAIVTGKNIAGVSCTRCVAIQSEKWAKHGSHSLRIISTNTSSGTSVYAILPIGADTAKRGTFLLTMHRDAAQPNRSTYNGAAYTNPVPQIFSEKWLGSGNNDIRIFAEPHPTNQYSSLLVRHDGIVNDPDLYLDGFLRTEGNYTGSYHDGNSENWIWNGEMNASSSRGPGK